MPPFPPFPPEPLIELPPPDPPKLKNGFQDVIPSTPLPPFEPEVIVPAPPGSSGLMLEDSIEDPFIIDGAELLIPPPDPPGHVICEVSGVISTLLNPPPVLPIPAVEIKFDKV